MNLDSLMGQMSKNNIKCYGAVAQLGERMTGSHEVSGSIPLSSTQTFYHKTLHSWGFLFEG